MQKKIIALAVAGLSTAAFAQTNVTIYGVADVSAQGTNMSSGSARNYSDTSGKPASGGNFAMKSNSSLIGFKGTEDLGNGLKALFQIETDVNLAGTDTGQSASVSAKAGNSGLGNLRDSYIGLNSKYGTVLGGYLSTPYRSTLTSFDVFPGATGDGRIETMMGKQRFGTGTGQQTGWLQANSSVRATAMAYALPTLYGFNGSIAYTGSNNNGTTNQNSTDVTSSQTNVAPFSALSLNLGWEGYGVAIKGAFQQAKVNTTVTWNNLAVTTTPASGYTSYLIGAQYTGLPGLKAGVVYNRNTMGINGGTVAGETFGANKGSNNQIWTGVSYRFGNNEPRLSYVNSSNTNFDGGSNQDGGNQWNLGWGYYLSKRTQVYGIASQIKNNANGVWNFASTSSLQPTGGQKMTTYGIGMRTNF